MLFMYLGFILSSGRGVIAWVKLAKTGGTGTHRKSWNLGPLRLHIHKQKGRFLINIIIVIGNFQRDIPYLGSLPPL